MAFTEDTGAFFSQDDFAVQLIWGAETADVILDAPDEQIIDGRVLSREYAITYESADLVGLTGGQAVTVDGIGYTVREVTALDDGKVMRATLRKT
jgi:hypothetical protein